MNAPAVAQPTQTSSTSCDVLIIGAGAAGLMAAAQAASHGASTLVIEKNRKAGVKILMSGGTRCNLTHHCDSVGIIDAFGANGKFLRQALATFSPQDTVALFNRLGVETKVENTGKVFPACDRAVVVRDALLHHAQSSGATIQLDSPALTVRASTTSDNSAEPPAGPFTITTPHQSISAQRLIVTAGGKSWPGCGTTGDGYAWLQQLGHSIVPPQPALVPLIGGTQWMHDLSGLTIDDVQVSVWSVNKAKRPLAVRRSSLLFTHKGFSGPAVMDISRAVTLHGPAAVKVLCDWTPDLSTTQMELWIDAQRKERGSSRIANSLAHWLPKRLADAICTAYNLHQIPLAEMSKVARSQVLQVLKAFELPIVDSAGFNKAEVTAGGVQLREIDPRTMASRIVPGLYIAGEILDLDGWIGGYNFQAAFSTGYVAGQAAARSLATATSAESTTPFA